MLILFVVNCSFPYGNAYSSRSRHIAKLLVECGHEVHVISPKADPGSIKNLNIGDRISTEYIYAPSNVLTLSGIGTAKPYIKAIKDYCRSRKPDIILSNNMNFVTEPIRRYAHKNGIKYIVEQCEWFDHSTFKYGRLNPAYIQHILQTEFLNKKVDGVIAISRLLEKHYNKLGLKTIRIPTILDADEVIPRLHVEKHSGIRLVFAGSLGKGKETLRPIIEEIISRQDRSIFLDIYGPSTKEIIINVGGEEKIIKEAGDNVRIHGRIPQEEIESVVRSADYSIFIRPNRRSSDAGFPTKLAESMMVGTPVISNDTGDIGLYVKDDKSGFCITESQQLSRIFDSILLQDENRSDSIRAFTRKCAEKNFDYKRYAQSMESFLKSVVR